MQVEVRNGACAKLVGGLCEGCLTTPGFPLSRE